MGTVISVLIAIVCILLVLIILVQNPKGGGLSSGLSSANQIGGVRKTTDFLEKATWTLAIGLVVLSLVSAGFVQRGGVIEDNSSKTMDKAATAVPNNIPSPESFPLPGGGTEGTPTPAEGQ